MMNVFVSAIFPSELYGLYIGMPVGRKIERAGEMAHYIALIHKDADSCYGVSFPEVPGVFTAGDTIDEANRKAAEVLEFAAEHWSDASGGKFRRARTIDELRADPDFQERAADAAIAVVPFVRRARRSLASSVQRVSQAPGASRRSIR